MKLASSAISYIFHPIFMPVLGLYLLVTFNEEVAFNGSENVSSLLKAIGIISCLVIMLALMMKNLGFVESLDTRDKMERVYLTAAAFICFGLVYYWLGSSGKMEFFHPMIFSAYLGALIAMGLSLIISFFYKISLHMIGVSGVFGMLYASENMALYPKFNLVLIVLCACGIVGSARMFKEAHKLNEVVLGFVLGTVCTYLSVSNGWTLY